MIVPKCDTCPIHQSQDYEACGLDYATEKYEPGTSSMNDAWGKPIKDTIIISKNCKLRGIILNDGAVIKPEYIEI